MDVTNNVRASAAAVKARRGALITYMLKFQSSALSNLKDMLYSSVETPTSGLGGLFAQPTASTTSSPKKTTTASASGLSKSLNIKV